MTTAIDRDLLNHWQSVTDDSEALIFADRLDEIGEGERAELVRVTVEIKRFPAVRDRNCKYGLPGEYVGPVDGHDAMRGDPCGRCNPSCRTLVKRRNDLESRLSVWPCKDCAGHPGLVDGPPGEWRYTATTCPACGGSGDLLRQTTQVGILAPQFHIDWWAGYPRYLTLLAMADAVERCPECESSSEPGWTHRHGSNGPGYYACRTCTDIENGEKRGSGYVATPRLRALCDPERPPPWGVLLEAVMVADREPHKSSYSKQWLWFEGDGDRYSVPRPLFDLLPGSPVPSSNGPRSHKVFDTPDAAKLALGVGIVAFARG